MEEKEYKKKGVDEMIREYKVGRTPNPDVSCNRAVKFGAFYDWAMKNGADFVSTGHYTRIEKNKLLAGSDNNKDQSYFLWQIRQEQLPHIIFPIGEMKKPEVRILAKKFGLVTAEKKDSQGLCFIGKVDMKEFLAHYIKPKKGKIMNENGEVTGQHIGAAFYTIGERLLGGYVVAKDMRSNTIMVAEKTSAGAPPTVGRKVVLAQCNWLAELKAGKRYAARTRYRQPLQSCTVALRNDRSLMLNRRASVHFELPQTVAPGQSLVLYDEEVVLGGGVIV